LASISIPSQFKKLAASVKQYVTGFSDPIEYSFLSNEDTLMFDDSDEYVTLTGDNSAGKTLVFHPGTLASGASLYIQYFASPTLLSSASQYVEMDDPQFAVDRTIAYIFEARSDPRFQIEESKATNKLTMMVENAEDAKWNSYAGNRPIITSLQRQGFRVGRD
jgi:hypothetical protein